MADNQAEVKSADSSTGNSNANQSADASDEASASKIGWVPSDQWKGDPAKHKSAKDFLEATRTSLPLVKAQRDRLQSQVEELQGVVLKNQNDMKTVVSVLSNQFQEKIKQQREEMDARYAEAVALGDRDAIRASMKEQRDFEAAQRQAATQATQAAPAQTQQAAPVPQFFTDWLERNTWFRSDKEAAAAAQAISVVLEKDGYTGKALLEKTEERMRERMPGLFAEEQRGRESRVEGATRGGRNTGAGKIRESEIPQALLDSYVGPGKAFKTTAEYLKKVNAE